MNLRLLVALFVAAMTSHVTQALRSWDTGRGMMYRLDVTQDVAIESGRSHHRLPYLLVGKHPGYPKKRSLLKFEDLPSSCPYTRVVFAKMYMYFVYAHKPSWHTPRRSPYLTRKVLVHRVLRPWNERQATRDIRLSHNRWSKPYLGLNDIDAEASPQSSRGTTMYSYRPSGFVEFDVKRAVWNWALPRVNNYGVLVKVEQEGNEGRGLRFASNAASDRKRHAFIHVYCMYPAPTRRPIFITPPNHLIPCRVTAGDRRICHTRKYWQLAPPCRPLCDDRRIRPNPCYRTRSGRLVCRGTTLAKHIPPED